MNRLAKRIVASVVCGLTVPSFALSTAATNFSGNSVVYAAVHAAKQSSSTSTKYITVRTGDSLWSIAAKNHTSVSALANSNHLSTKSVLHVGQRLAVPSAGKPAKLSGRSASMSTLGSGVVAADAASYAQNFVGVPYHWAGTSPSGFDCSGFVMYVYRHFGVNLPRTSNDMFHVGSAVSRANLTPGDLVFFNSYGPGASHVGIYLGGGRFISAQSGGVKVASLSDGYWAGHYVGARDVN